MSTIFSQIPVGVTVRRLNNQRNAKNQSKPYSYSAKINNHPRTIVYGKSIRDVVKKLGKDIEVAIQ